MINDLEDYIESHISPQSRLLHKIDRDTNLRYVNGRMCSGHIQGRLLKMLIRMIRPQRVIELGTFTGYSALCIAEALEDDALIDTIEVDDEMKDIILDNFSKSPHGNKIRLHIGDAVKILDDWTDREYDLAFIDADKRQYSEYFKKLWPMIRPGGFMIADNTLWDGHVTESGPHSSQTQGILDFNNLIMETRGAEISIIPIRDGITLIHKTEKQT